MYIYIYIYIYIFRGVLDAINSLAGQAAGGVRSIEPAKKIVLDMVGEASILFHTMISYDNVLHYYYYYYYYDLIIALYYNTMYGGGADAGG